MDEDKRKAFESFISSHFDGNCAGSDDFEEQVRFLLEHLETKMYRYRYNNYADFNFVEFKNLFKEYVVWDGEAFEHKALGCALDLSNEPQVNESEELFHKIWTRCFPNEEWPLPPDHGERTLRSQQTLGRWLLNDAQSRCRKIERLIKEEDWAALGLSPVSVEKSRPKRSRRLF